MPNRRKKSSPIPAILFWIAGITVVGWGAYQGRNIWREVTDVKPVASQTAPETESGPRVIAVKVSDSTDKPMPLYTIDGLEGTADALIDDRAEMPDEARPEPGPTFDATLSTDDLRSIASHLLETGETVRARSALNAALARSRDEAADQLLRDMLRGLNRPIYLGTDVLPEDPGARMVEIQPGDSFTRLGHDFGVPAAFLEAINPSLNARGSSAPEGAKIVEGPFHLHVIKHASRIDLYAREMYIDSFSVEFPEGNSLPSGDYRVAEDGKIKLSLAKTWIQFEGADSGTEGVKSGWIFGTAGPRGTSTKDRETGIHLADADLAMLYNVLVERRSRLRVER